MKVRPFLLGLAVLAAASLSSASAHRMPEVEVTIETTTIDEAQRAAFTVRLHAEDTLKLLGLERDVDANLADAELLRTAAAKLQRRLKLDGDNQLEFLGGTVEGNAVYLFFVGAPDVQVADAAMLSSVFNRWTNRINDRRSGSVETQVFTQGGEIEGHRH